MNDHSNEQHVHEQQWHPGQTCEASVKIKPAEAATTMYDLGLGDFHYGSLFVDAVTSSCISWAEAPYLHFSWNTVCFTWPQDHRNMSRFTAPVVMLH